MTNEQIIFNASVELMENGTIKGTGRFFEYQDEEGAMHRLEEPEELHTFAAWKDLGRVVRKGEKCVAKIQIWKYAKSKKAEENEETADASEGRCFMKTAAFFTFSQTEPLKERSKK